MPGYEAQLKGILDGIAESIADATDEEIIEEATEIDKEKARRLKALMIATCEEER
jgi:hypothetical protein